MNNINVVMALFTAGTVVNGLRQLLDWSVTFTYNTMCTLSAGLWLASFVVYLIPRIRDGRKPDNGEKPE